MTAEEGSARDEVLARVRAALATPGTHHPRTDVPLTVARPEGVPVPSAHASLLDLLVDRVEDYRARVVRCAPGGLADALRAALEGAESVVVPAGFDGDLLDLAGPRRVDESSLGEVHDVEGIAAVVSTATTAIAETGTIVLDHGPGQGRRGLTLLPDLHVCVVRSDQVVATVPEAVAALRPSIDQRRPLTWVSGPSATSDIELDRVEGVHGPRTLCVLLVDVAS
ncbi:hypothetical protein UB45_13370 [Terrabacter sp. 28]|nr:hypothetical protein UB45_13370 [Terrabacter sp. 28]